MATEKAKTRYQILKDARDGGGLGDDTVDSQHFVAASIDNEHLADDAVDSAELTAGSVDPSHFAAGALSADATGRAVMADAFFDVTTFAAKVDAGAIARAKLTEEALQAFRIPLASVLGADGADLAITETAGDFYRSIGANQLLILGEVSNGTTEADREVSVGWFEFQLPVNYVSGGDITIRAGVDITGAGAIEASTIDFETYLQNGLTGAVGSDLVSTAATAITATEANKDFVVTPTSLVAGDLLVVKMTTSVSNTNSTAIQAQIARLEVLCDVKG